MQKKYKEANEYCVAYKSLVNSAIKAIEVERDIFSLHHDLVIEQAYEDAATDLLLVLQALIIPDLEVTLNVDI